MKISVCIPTYNRADLLGKTLISVSKQTVRPYEVIVVDNCSDDDTEAVVRSFKDVLYYRNERNLGLVGNWNRCIDLAKGDFLTILHSDDLISPFWCEMWMPILTKYENSNVGSFFCDLFTIDMNENAKIFYRVLEKECLLKEIENIRTLWKHDLYGTPVSGGLIIRKSVFEKIGKFREEYKTETDVLTILRLLNQFPVYYLPKHLFAYRVHPFQTFDSDKVKKTDEKKYKVLTNYLGIVKTFYNTELNPRNKEPEFYKRPALMYISIAVFYVLMWQFEKARKYKDLVKEVFPDLFEDKRDFLLLFSIIFHYIKALSCGRFTAIFKKNIAKSWVRP